MKTIKTALAGLAMAWATFVHSADYPNHPIRLIVPYNAGGSADASARPLANQLSKVLGQSVIIENRPGAQSVIGSNLVAKSAADGYTLLYTSGGTVLAPHLVENAPFAPAKDLPPVAILGSFPYVFTAHAQAGFSTLQELVDHARAHPGKVSIAVGDPVTESNARRFIEATGLDLIVVNYTGGGAMISDLLGRHVDLAILGAGAYLPHAKSGNIKGIVATSVGRQALLAQIPTLHELGYPQLVMDNFYGVAAPAGLPHEVDAKLREALAVVLQQPGSPFQSLLIEQGYEPATDLSAAAGLEKYLAYDQAVSPYLKKAAAP